MEALYEARSKVNGKFLHLFSGKPVSALGNIIKVNPNGLSFDMKSTDNMVVNVILQEPYQDLMEGWVEVRGTGQGKGHIIAQHLLVVPPELTEKFDVDLYDDLITVMNSCNNPWVNS